MKNAFLIALAVFGLASCAETTTETQEVETTVSDSVVVVDEPVEGGSDVAKPEEAEEITE